MDEQLLKDFLETAKQNQYNWDVIMPKFPELEGIDLQLLKDYTETAIKYNYDYDVINPKFPEFFGEQYEVKKKDESTFVAPKQDGELVTEDTSLDTQETPETTEYQPQNILEPIESEDAEFEASLKTSVTPEMISEPEEFVVPEMQYKFGKYGFDFEESTTNLLGTDAMLVKVRGTDKKLKVKLDRWWGKEGTSKELEKFLRENKRKESEILKQSQAIVQNQRTVQTEEELNATIKLFNQQSERFQYEVNEYAKARAKLDSIYNSNFSNVSKELRKNNPVLKANYDEWLKQSNELDLKLKDIEGKYEDFKYRGAKLDKTAGEYTAMKAQQGTWWSGFWNEMMASAGPTFTPMSSLIDLTTYLDEKVIEGDTTRGEEYKKDIIKIAKKKGLAPEGLNEDMSLDEVVKALGGDTNDVKLFFDSIVTKGFLNTPSMARARAMKTGSTKGGIQEKEKTNFDIVQDALLDIERKTKKYYEPKVDPSDPEGKRLISARERAFADALSDDPKFRNPFSVVGAQKDNFGNEGMVSAGRDAYNFLKDKSTTEQWAEVQKQGNFLKKGFLGLGGSLFAMLGTSSPLGWAQRTAQMYNMSTDYVDQEMEKNPMFDKISEAEKTQVKMPIGIATAVLENIGLRNIISQKGLLNSLVSKALRKSNKNTNAKTFQEFIRQDIESMIARGALVVTGAGLAEFETGLAQEIAAIEIKDVYNATKEAKMFETPETFAAYMGQVVEAGLAEMVGGLVMGSIPAVTTAVSGLDVQNLQPEVFEIFEKTIQEPTLKSAYISKLKNRIADPSNELDKKEAQKELDLVNKLEGILVANRIPFDEFNTNQRKEALQLLLQKETLENEIKEADKVLSKPKQELLDRVNKRLEKLTGESIDTQEEAEIESEGITQFDSTLEEGGKIVEEAVADIDEFRSLEQDEQIKFLDQAGKELLEEAEARGETEIEITEAQSLQRAVELFKKDQQTDTEVEVEEVVYEMNKTNKKIWSKDFEILDNRQGQEQALFDEEGNKTSDKWWIVNKVTGQIIEVDTKAMAKDVIANAPAYAEAFGDGTKVEANMLVTPAPEAEVEAEVDDEVLMTPQEIEKAIFESNVARNKAEKKGDEGEVKRQVEREKYLSSLLDEKTKNRLSIKNDLYSKDAVEKKIEELKKDPFSGFKFIKERIKILEEVLEEYNKIEALEDKKQFELNNRKKPGNIKVKDETSLNVVQKIEQRIKTIANISGQKRILNRLNIFKKSSLPENYKNLLNADLELVNGSTVKIKDVMDMSFKEFSDYANNLNTNSSEVDTTDIDNQIEEAKQKIESYKKFDKIPVKTAPKAEVKADPEAEVEEELESPVVEEEETMTEAEIDAEIEKNKKEELVIVRKIEALEKKQESLRGKPKQKVKDEIEEQFKLLKELVKVEKSLLVRKRKISEKKTDKETQEEQEDIKEFFKDELGESISPNLTINKEGKPEKVNKLKPRIIKIAKASARSIAKLLDETKIVLHESKSEYFKYTGKTSSGYYDTTTDTIHIDLTNARLSTVPHEVFHAVFLNKLKTDAKARAMAIKMVESVKKTLSKNSKLYKEIDAFTKLYTGDQEQFREEEFIAELIGLMSSQEFKKYKQLKAPAKYAIVEFLKKIAKKFGIKLGSEFGKDDQSVIDLINVLATKTVTGEEITEEDVEILSQIKKAEQEAEEIVLIESKAEQENAVEEVEEVTNIKKEANRIALEILKNKEKYKTVIAEVGDTLNDISLFVSTAINSYIEGKTNKIVEKSRLLKDKITKFVRDFKKATLVALVLISSFNIDANISNQAISYLEDNVKAFPSYLEKGLHKYGLIDVVENDVAEIVIETVAPVQEVVTLPESEIHSTEKESRDNKGTLSVHSSYHNNDVGQNYEPIPTKGNQSAPKIIDGSAVAHFFILDNRPKDFKDIYDADQTELLRQSKWFKSRGSWKNASNETYFPVFTKLDNGQVNVVYKKKGDINNNDAVIQNLVQYKSSEIAWNKEKNIDLKASQYKRIRGAGKSKTLVTKSGDIINSVIYTTRKKYSKFSGAAGIFIAETSNGEVFVKDFSGSVNNMIDGLKDFSNVTGVSQDNITIGFYDAGSVTAKPSGKNGKLKRSDWYGYNTKLYSGSGLALRTDFDAQAKQDVAILNGSVSGVINASPRESKSVLTSFTLKRFPTNPNIKLSEDTPLSNFNQKKSNLLESDRMTGAFIADAKNNPVFKFFGGIYFPQITGKWWASRTISKATSIAENMNANRDKDGYIYATPIIMKPNSHMSNQDMFETVWEFMKFDLRSKSSKVTKKLFSEYLTKALSLKSVRLTESDLNIKKSDNIETMITKLNKVLLGDDTTLSFEKRKAIIKAILGDPKVTEDRKFPTAGSISEVASKFEEEKTKKATKLWDIVMLMRTKGTLSTKVTPKSDEFYHKSYPAEIFSDQEIEVFFLDGAYNIDTTYPELTQSSGKVFSWKEYSEKHPSTEMALSQYGRTAKLSKASGNIVAPPQSREQKSVSELESNLENKYDVTLDLYQNKDFLELDKIIVTEDQRNTGVGSNVMREVIDFANKKGLTIALTPSTSYGATSIDRLKGFYKGLGFVENKGINKDFTTKQSMLKLPEVKGRESKIPVTIPADLDQQIDELKVRIEAESVMEFEKDKAGKEAYTEKFFDNYQALKDELKTLELLKEGLVPVYYERVKLAEKLNDLNKPFMKEVGNEFYPREGTVKKGKKIKEDKDLGGIFEVDADGYLFRGVSKADFYRILSTRFIDTDLRGTISEKEGINLAPNASTAFNYLPEGVEGVVMAIKVDKDMDLFMIGADDYVRSAKPIPYQNVKVVTTPSIEGRYLEIKDNAFFKLKDYAVNQEVQTKPKKEKTIYDIADSYYYGNDGYFNAKPAPDLTYLKREVESVPGNYSVKKASTGGLFLTQNNIIKKNLSRPKGREQKSTQQIINEGRQANFKESNIRDFLVRVLNRSAKEVDELMNLDKDFLEVVPKSFTNIKGGIKAGTKLYNRVEAYRKKLVKKNDKLKGNKKLTSTQIVDKTIEYLQKQPEYINEGDKYTVGSKKKGTQETRVRKGFSTQQARMLADYTKTAGVRPTNNMGAKIRKAMAAVRQKVKGARDLQKQKTALRNFIRQSLPKALYTKKDAIDLVNKVNDVNAGNIENLMKEVIEFVNKTNVKSLQAQIKLILNKKYSKVESGRKKPVKISDDIRKRIDFINSIILNDKATPAQIGDALVNLQNRFNELAAEVNQTEDTRSEMVDLELAMMYINTLQLEDTNETKVEQLDQIVQTLKEMIEDGRSQLKEQIREQHLYYLQQFELGYEAITGNKIDMNEPDAFDELNKIKKIFENEKAKRDTQNVIKRFLRSLREGIDRNFFGSAEDLFSLMDRLDKLPGEMYGGNLQEMFTERVDEATRLFKGRMMLVEQLIQEHLKGLYGKNWKKQSRQNRLAKDTGIMIQDGVPLSPKSQNQIAYLYNMYKDPANRKSFANPEMYGIKTIPKDATKAEREAIQALNEENAERVMSEMIALLDPKVKETADWQVNELYPFLYNHYNDAYKKLYRTDLPWNEFYAGTIYREGVDQEEASILDLQNARNIYSTAVGASGTKVRENSNKAIKSMDMMDVLNTYLNQMEYFAAYGEVVRDMSKLFNNKYISDAITKIHGKDVYKYTLAIIDKIASRGTSDSRNNTIVNAMNNVFILSRLAISPVIMIKQLTSFITYANDIGPLNYLKYAAKNKVEMLKVYKEIRDNSVYMKDRQRTSIMRAIETYSDANMKKFVPAGTKDWIVNFAMWTTKFGDKSAIFLGGMPNYSYYKAQFKKKNPGATEQEAIDYAVKLFERDTKRTQQSGDLQDKDYYQTKDPLYRGLNMFLTTPKQYLRKEIVAIRNLNRKLSQFDRKAGKGTVAQNLRTFFMYHVIMPVFFQYVSMGLPGILRDERDDDKLDLLRAAMIGNLNALFIVGDLFQMAGDLFTGKPWAGNNVKTVGLLSIAASLTEKFAYAAKLKDPAKKAEAYQKAYLELATFTSVPAPTIAKFVENYGNIGKDGDIGKDILRLLNFSKYQIEGPGKGGRPKKIKTIQELNEEYDKKKAKEQRSIPKNSRIFGPSNRRKSKSSSKIF